MDTSRKPNLPTLNQNNNNNNNKTTSSSSSSPDFLRDVQAAFKRYRTMPRSKNLQTRRSVVHQRETLKSSGPMIDSKAEEAHKQSCDCRIKNMADSPCLKCGHVLDGPKKVQFASGNGAQSDEMEYDINNQLDGSTAPRHNGNDQSFHNMEVDLGSRSNDETSLVAKGTTRVQNQVDLIKNFMQCDFGHQMTSSSVVGSNCATTTLVDSVNAPMLSSTTQNSQPSHHVSSSSDLKYQQMRPIDTGFNNNSKILADQNLSAALDPNPNNKCVLRRDQHSQEAGSSGMPNDPLLLVDKSTKGAGDIMDLQSQTPISNDQMYDVKPVSTESGKGTTGVQNQVDPLKKFLHRDFGHQMTSSSVVDSNCATTTLVNSVNAPMLSSTTQNSQPSHHGSSHVGSSSDLKYQQMKPIDMGFNNNSKVLADQNLSAAVDPNPNNKCVLWRDQQGKEAGSSGMPNDPLLLVDKSTKGAGDTMDLQPQAPISNDRMYDVKPVSTKSGKNEKHASKKDVSAPRKRNYDPDLFFKVNGKLYQRLGKIGSGGSSEVHKVISQDCTIYALKRIKLKGRDYATAYGFCQEIEYLNKLRGKDHIIQLIDYEVTDKALLKEVMSGSMSNKDGRVKDDGLIYMVLEYGEIDLAHMLSQKWKELEDFRSTIDENWLRFYWQQILLAVKTIHEERIVHSDLKPANFLLVRGSLKLIDFGIAKAILSDTTNIQRDSQVGTLSYMSPEAFLCNETDANGNIIKCGRPSDIWSLGCILYQMVYGRTPFADYTTFWAKFKVITDPNHEIHYEPLSNIWLLDLMKKCLAWERNERWTIPQLLQHPFLVPPISSSVSNHNILQLVADSCIEDPNLLDEMSKLCLQLKEQRANSKCD